MQFIDWFASTGFGAHMCTIYSQNDVKGCFYLYISDFSEAESSLGKDELIFTISLLTDYCRSHIFCNTTLLSSPLKHISLCLIRTRHIYPLGLQLLGFYPWVLNLGLVVHVSPYDASFFTPEASSNNSHNTKCASHTATFFNDRTPALIKLSQDSWERPVEDMVIYQALTSGSGIWENTEDKPWNSSIAPQPCSKSWGGLTSWTQTILSPSFSLQSPCPLSSSSSASSSFSLSACLPALAPYTGQDHNGPG